MESLGLTIDYEFFKKKMDYFLWLEKQQRGLENLFDCDIYGGPAKAWEYELAFWRIVLKSEETYGLLISFASFYSSPHSEYTSNFEYDWNDDDESFTYYSGKVELNTVPSRENWAKAIWSQICAMEEKYNESKRN